MVVITAGAPSADVETNTPAAPLATAVPPAAAPGTPALSQPIILAEKKSGCPTFYGVRSYLHNFYEEQDVGAKDPSLFESHDEYALLLRPRPERRTLCRPLIWKICVWIGVNLLVFGIVGIFVSYLVPQKVVYKEYAQHIVLNRVAQRHNANLELVKLVGLMLFCVGGAITVVALLVPTLMWRHCQDYTDEGLRVRIAREPKASDSGAQISIAPGGQLISTKMNSVQPDRRQEESLITQTGLKSVQP